MKRPFEVGQRVRVYDFQWVRKDGKPVARLYVDAEVTHVDYADGSIRVCDDQNLNKNVAPQQCRKLKVKAKPKPSRLWIHGPAITCLARKILSDVVIDSGTTEHPGVGWREFVEVCK